MSRLAKNLILVAVVAAILAAVWGAVTLAQWVQEMPEVQFAEIPEDYSLDDPKSAQAAIAIIEQRGDFGTPISEHAVIKGPFLVWDIVGDSMGGTPDDPPKLAVVDADYLVYENGEKVLQFNLTKFRNGTYLANQTITFRNNCEQYSDIYCVFGDMYYEQFVITKTKLIDHPDFFRYYGGIDYSGAEPKKCYFESEFDYAAVANYHGREMLRRSLEAYEPQTLTLAELRKLGGE